MTHVHDCLLFSFRALLPELLTFAYIPANHLKVNGTSQQPDLRKDIFTDYAGSARPIPYNEDEHVLILEMDDNMVRKRKSPSNSQVSPGIGSIF